MVNADEQYELDDRFPTGEWTGFYLQPDTRQRHLMDLCLQFAHQTISGSGNDQIGDFTIGGVYDKSLASCSWTKKYVGKHCVDYTGQARERGIVGQWQIVGQPAFWSGAFFIWPREFGNLEAGFEKAFMERELMPQFIDSPT